MKKDLIVLLTAVIGAALFSGCAKEADVVSELGLTTASKEATENTIKENSAIYELLDFEDDSEYQNAVKGLIDAPEELEIKDENGNVIWSQKAYAFLENYEKAPDTVNPSLWENTRNNHTYGLFEVIDGIYQVRGYDMTNLTLVKGNTGWIVFDPLMSVECTQAAMELVEKNLGKYPIEAIIISHSHVDHFGGIRGLITDEDVADKTLSIKEQIDSGKIPVIVPENFEEYAVSENIYAGKAMSRRASYQYGVGIEISEKGPMAIGIGMGQSVGTVSYISPTYEICKTGETIEIDGVVLEFQLTPGTEAPAEMNTWFPEKNALWAAENCTGTLHNLYTLRGAQVRDGAEWARYITDAVGRYGDDVEVVFQSHNWPHWGNETVVGYMLNTAAVYKYINDQTLTYLNQGYTSDEISNMIQLPEELEKNWYTRQYYGTVAHDAKAVYQKYMGWYDGNPTNLNPLEPTESAKKWVEYMGDVDEVLRKAKEDFENGEYQWVAKVTNTIVYAEPENMAARMLCADALEQLGYQAESGAWRNAYLKAAQELRGTEVSDILGANSTGDVAQNMTAKMILDYYGIVLDKNALAKEKFKINFVLTDTQEKYVLYFNNGALLIFEEEYAQNTDVTITCPKNAMLLLLQNNMEAFVKIAKIEGNEKILEKFAANMTQLTGQEIDKFNIVEP